MSVRARLYGQIRRVLDGLAAKRETRRAIRELSALSDRELRDIGVTRADICRVASEGVSGFRADSLPWMSK
jgi:uncharacterized protein YjiS (DUF1127 family)